MKRTILFCYRWGIHKKTYIISIYLFLFFLSLFKWVVCFSSLLFFYLFIFCKNIYYRLIVWVFFYYYTLAAVAVRTVRFECLTALPLSRTVCYQQFGLSFLCALFCCIILYYFFVCFAINLWLLHTHFLFLLSLRVGKGAIHTADFYVSFLFGELCLMLFVEWAQ